VHHTLLRTPTLRRRAALSILGAGVVTGALAVELTGRSAQFAAALKSAPIWILSLAIVLQLVSLVARTEAWNVCIRAAGATTARRVLFRAAGVGYLFSLLNGSLGPAARLASLRRAAPRQAPASRPCWPPSFRSLVLLGVCAQIARNWLVLRGLGVHVSLLDAIALLIAMFTLGQLPIGPSLGAAAAVLILGAHGVAIAAAAGVLLTATATAGSLTYAGWAVIDPLIVRDPAPPREGALAPSGA
jgi:uncharacterized membrane protein YbhN (UPF0104 family)